MKGIRLLILAGLAGTLAAIVVALATRGSDPGAAPAPKVLMTRAAVVAGSPVGAGQVEAVALNNGGTVPAGAITDPASLEGRIARRDIAAGSVVFGSDLWQAGIDGSLSPAPGRLAFSTRTGDIGQVIGFEGPGSRVDVLLSATRNVPQPFSRVVLRGARVLAIAPEAADEKAAAGASRSSRVTLELTPAEAERLDLARHVGDLTLVVRSADTPVGEAAESRGARIADLLGTSTSDLMPGPTVAAATAASSPSTASSRASVRPAKDVPARQPAMVEEIRGGQMMRREGPAESGSSGS
jgi:pilus assembly protein CpaB